MSKKLTTEEFIANAQKVHCSKYDYSKVEYKGNKANVKIICPIHGEFEQRAENHLHGFGCKKCSKKYHYSNDEWISIAKKIHNNRYDYSLVNYVNNHTKVKIICPIHGIFEKYPSDHINGNGCQKCSWDEMSKRYTLSNEEFVSKSKEVHKDKYDYSSVKYIDAHTNVSIICPVHGEFSQLPYVHLDGCGCPKCNQSSLEKEISNMLLNNGIESKQCKRFEWLGLQHLDFYLPKYDIAIECQGEQHYKSVEQFGGECEFLKLQERDQRKKKLCGENGIKLLYFTHYKNVDENEVTFKDTNKLLNEILKHELR